MCKQLTKNPSDALVPSRDISRDLVRRSTPNAPDGYTPATVDCPSTRPTLREASGLSSQESQWLNTRRPNTLQPMQQLLSRIAIPNFDAAGYFSTHMGNISMLPNIGVAASGGGYRALMNGAGALAAFDDRTINSTNAGQLGGLLQATTYLAGLSGGSWLVGSLFANNFTSVQNIIDTHGETWNFADSIFEGPQQGIGIISTTEYYHDITDQVSGKSDSPLHFNISVTDYWGRALSYQLVNATDGGPAYTMSSIASQSFFTQGTSPLPLLISDNRAPGQQLIPANTTIFEFNPWEMGSWDPTVYAFAPMEFVGSNFSGGMLPDDEPCVRGFDNMGYVMGTSSTLFNEFLLEFNSTVKLPDFLESAIQDVLAKVGAADNDIADWTPNPFYNYNNGTNIDAASKRLTLVDGGEDNQNIPFHPLIQPPRAVDVIFAIDSSADTTNNWPNGSSLVATYERSQNAAMENGTGFPSIPPTQTFVNLGLNSRPTFFGCNASNFTTAPPPLIVYLPNSPYVYNSNLSTFDPSYNSSERNAVIENGYDVATRGNGTGDSQWPVCVGCALLARSLDRTGTAYPAACNSCFETYCWNGTVDNTVSAYDPKPSLPAMMVKVTSGVSALTPRVGGLLVAVVVAVMLL